MSASSSAFERRSAEMGSRRLERLARASSRGIALAQQALRRVRALEDVSGNVVDGTGALGPVSVVGRGGAFTVPPAGFKQGSLVRGLFSGDPDGDDVAYMCFGNVFVPGRPVPSLLIVVLEGGVPFEEVVVEPGNALRIVIPLDEFFGGDGGPEVHHAVTTPGNQYVVPTPADEYALGEVMAFPYFQLDGGLVVAVTEAPLPFAIPYETYRGRGVQGLDGAVYFLPYGGLPILRLDPASGALTFVPLPEDAGSASFRNGALHPPSGHIVAAPEAGTQGRVLAIDTSPGASPSSAAFWLQGATRAHADFSFFGDQAIEIASFTGPEGVMQLTDLAVEADDGVTSGIAWNPAAELFFLSAGYALGDLVVLRYVPGGASEARRFPMRTGLRPMLGFTPHTNAIFNPARGTTVLLPADSPRLTEIEYAWEDETPPRERALFYFAFPFGPKFFGAVVHAGRLLCFPFLGLSNRVLDLDAARDPDADNVVSFYGY
jgi:hypothetical protein